MFDGELTGADLGSETWLDEEPWEFQIAGMLGSLAPVEPPDGFLTRAVDHRPRFAGRTLVGLGLSSVVLVAVVVAAGGLGSARGGTPTTTGPGSGDAPVSALGQAAVGDDLIDPFRSLQSSGVVDRVRDVAAAVSTELGFPSLD